MANPLQYEHSPYLQQHKDNPVNWHPWGAEAFQKAKSQDKPILLSIGYATCHWCHVMARESFEDESIASLMNELFINIKVDREELPAVDHYYMDAVQLLTGAGGWPMNCFLTPDKKPFLGGTYFPPDDRGRQVSWRKVLLHVAKVFQQQRAQVEEQAKRVHSRIESQQTESLNSLLNWEGKGNRFDIEALMKQTQASWDRDYGGMKGAPKFPMSHFYTSMLQWGLKIHDDEILSFVKRTARAFIHGGLFDPVHGGFARYCVDSRWNVPHFEKMLYDNAGILKLLTLLDRSSGHPVVRWGLKKTVDFLENQMRDEDGLFFSAIDADSEGEEGKFYVWTYAEMNDVLGPQEYDLLNSYFDISKNGNWEETNVLYTDWVRADQFLKEHSLENLDRVLAKLKVASRDRVPPSTDTKKLMDWNALLIHSLFLVARYSDLQKAGDTALKSLDRLLLEAVSSTGELTSHAKKGDDWYGEPTIDDYAFLIQACISGYAHTFQHAYLRQAESLTEHAISLFSEDDVALFYSISKDSKQLDHRPIAYFDTPYPSGNSIMCKNLHILGKYLDRMDWIHRAEKMLHQLEDKIQKSPSALGSWLDVIIQIQEQNHEIAIIGPKAKDWGHTIKKEVLPGSIVMADSQPDSSIPLLDRISTEDKTQIFLCENYTCSMPIDDLDSFWKQYATNNPILHESKRNV